MLMLTVVLVGRCAPEFNVRAHYRPQRSWGKVIFSQASVILLPGGACVVAQGEACVVAPRGGVCAWLLPGGSCMVALGGVHGCSRGTCMVAPRGCVWLLPGGHMCGCSRGACMVAPGGACMGYDKIRRYDQ